MRVGELRSQDIGMGLQSLVGVNGQHPLAGGVAQRGVPGGRKGVLPFAPTTVAPASRAICIVRSFEPVS